VIKVDQNVSSQEIRYLSEFAVIASFVGAKPMT
jgi:hypothetical protein